MGQAHKLNADYFTIHPAKIQSSKDASEPSTRRSSALHITSRYEEEEEDEDVNDMRTLLIRLRKAEVDREKTMLVLKFMDEGGDELHYLADEVCVLTQQMISYANYQLMLP